MEDKNAKIMADPNVKDKGTFDYVKYDDIANEAQALFKTKAEEFLAASNRLIKCPRSKALVKTKLEEAYMWVGKGIRNDQIERNGSAPLQKSRG